MNKRLDADARSAPAAPVAPDDDPGLAPGGVSLAATFTSLRHRNYRLWFIGQMVSLFGTWMHVTAQGFLVYELTHSPAYLGYVGFVAGVPAWLLMLYAGVVADRIPRRRLLMLSQGSMMLLAVAMAGLTWAGLIQPWHILVMAFLGGIANAFDAPARQSFVLELVHRDELTNALALNSSVFNLATTLGPALAGFVYAAVGPAWCFAINALSFVALLVGLAAMRLPPKQFTAVTSTAWDELVTGLRFVGRHSTIRVLLLGLAVTSVFGFSMMTLTPVWATDVLMGDARTNGALLSARGLGSLLGALMIAMLGRFLPKGLALNAALIGLPFSMALFAVVRGLPLAFVTLVVAGWLFMIVFNMLNSLIQLHAPDDLRGRVMSVYGLTFFGLMPFGAMMVGGLAGMVGAPATVAGNAVLVLLFAGVLWLRFPKVRRLD